MNNILGLLDQLESNYITVQQNRCVMVRNRNATCMKCAKACTSGCISFAEGTLVVAPEKCIGCGTCATVCPTCALEAHMPNDAELFNTLKAISHTQGGGCTVACEQFLEKAEGLYDPEKVVPVKCLGRIEESLLIQLANAGIERIDLVRSACERCTHVSGRVTAGLVCESATTLLEAWNSTTTVNISDKLPTSTRLNASKDHDYDKRALFVDMKSNAKKAAIATADLAAKEKLMISEKEEPRFVRVMADGTLPHFLPDRRERLLDGLASLGEPQDVMLGTRLWGHVVIDTDRCSSCRMCATFCPTGAIAKFQDEDGTFGVAHYPGDCVKCHCCLDICPEGALSISDEVFARDLLSGAVDRYEMVAPENPPGTPHAILDSMKGLINSDQVYER